MSRTTIINLKFLELLKFLFLVFGCLKWDFFSFIGFPLFAAPNILPNYLLLRLIHKILTEIYSQDCKQVM